MPNGGLRSVNQLELRRGKGGQPDGCPVRVNALYVIAAIIREHLNHSFRIADARRANRGSGAVNSREGLCSAPRVRCQETGTREGWVLLLTPTLSCQRPRNQAAHQYAGLSAVQPHNRNDFLESRACPLQRHVRWSAPHVSANTTRHVAHPKSAIVEASIANSSQYAVEIISQNVCHRPTRSRADSSPM
jgi:hypothetical protein